MFYINPMQTTQLSGNQKLQSQMMFNNTNNLIALSPFKVKKPVFKPHSKFNEEEDARLRELVKQYGDNQWITIASEMPGRNSRQCRERWLNYLSPKLNTNKWTPEEDELLLEKQKEFGTSWVRICKFFEGRTDQMCKNRFFLLQRKLEKKANKRRNISSQQTSNLIVPQQILFPINASSVSSCNSSPIQFEIKKEMKQKDLNQKKENIEIDTPVVRGTTDLGFLDLNTCQEPYDNFFNLSDEAIIDCDEFFMI